MMVSVNSKVHFAVGGSGRRELRLGDAPEAKPEPVGRVPRIARLMALAIRFERLIEAGAITDQAELARLGHVTRARVTQIMNLLHLAPDIQEAILYLPRVTEGRDPISERQIRPIAAEIDWERQRAMWLELVGASHYESMASDSGQPVSIEDRNPAVNHSTSICGTIPA